MNERDFFYSEPDGDTGAPAEETAPAVQENAAPVADSSMATTDHTSDAPAAAVEQVVSPEPAPAAEPVADAAPAVPADAVQATEQAAGEVALPMSDASFADAVAATTAPDTKEAPVADAAPAAEPVAEAPKPAPVVITDEILARLQAAKDNSEAIEVHVSERVRGGLRVVFDNVKLFLPASQFFIKKTPTDDELQAVVGQNIHVNVFEIQKDDTGKISIIASRKSILKNQFLQTVKVGDTVEGTVSSVMPFGVFVDIGGFDGLIHISRISHNRVEDPNTLFKKGDTVKAKIIEIDPAKDKIALSMRELEPSPWSSIEADYPVGSSHKGIVRRITDFGAYVELKPGIDGLLRVSEMSWTKRVNHPSEHVQVNQEVDVVITNASAEKRQVGLSTRRLLENPWNSIAEKFPVGAETTGLVSQVIAQGAVITIGGEIDGFMPRSKMRDVMKGAKRIPYNQGDMVSVIIADLNPAEHTLILAPKSNPEDAMFGSPRDRGERSERGERRDRGERRERGERVPKEAEAPPDSNFSIMDLLSDSEKNSLFNKE